MKKKSYLTLVTSVLLGLTNCSDANIESREDEASQALTGENEHSTGLLEETAEGAKKLHRFKIERVKPKRLAVSRANHERRKKKQPEIDDPEADDRSTEITVSENGILSTELATAPAVAILPSAADNSMLPSAPPVGNQGREGSCAAWATTYYQLSHETCLARGCNNKNIGATVFSPKWTYNLINSGVDSGSSFSTAFGLLEQSGAASLIALPYAAGDYRSWDIDPQQWRTALNYRANYVQYATAVDTAAGLNNVKQLLANGHFLTYATYVYSWVLSDVKAPAQYAGQKAMVYVNGAAGAHAMTIVGYDDSIWIDVNGNKVQDSGEMGALKIANSWGSGWGNAGFLWVAYDSLKATSAVTLGPSASRIPAFWDNYVYSVTARPSYKPHILGQLTLSTATRNQVYVTLGTSATAATAPSLTLWPVALFMAGGPYAFDGSTVAAKGSFLFDFTEIMQATTTAQKYYLTVYDAAAGSPTSILDYQLINGYSGVSVPTQGGFPQTIDGRSMTLLSSYDYPKFNLPPIAQIAATQIISAAAVAVDFSGLASSDKDGSIASYQWDFGDGSPVATAPATSHSFTRAGAFFVNLTVTDNLGAIGTATFPVVVADTEAPSAPTGLSGNVVTGPATTSVALRWTRSSDNVGISNYVVYRNGSTVGSGPNPSFSDSTSATVGQTYHYTVVAFDAAGNASAASNTFDIQR